VKVKCESGSRGREKKEVKRLLDEKVKREYMKYTWWQLVLISMGVIILIVVIGELAYWSSPV
jgi:hypothetical protein